MTAEQKQKITDVVCTELCKWVYESSCKDDFAEKCAECPLLAELNEIESGGGQDMRGTRSRITDEGEYIGRNAAIRLLCDECNKINSDEPCEPSDCFINQALRHLQTADVTEVRRGKWKEQPWAEEINGLLASNYICSCCNGWARYKTLYCPDCGAKMEVGV